MRYTYFTTILFFVITIKALCKNDSLQVSCNIIYIEAGGAGGYGSINYERILLAKKKSFFSIRCGLGTYNFKDYTNKFNPDVLIPLSVNACYGKNHKLELGLGQTITAIVYQDFTGFKPTRKTNLSTHFLIGYRYQKKHGKLFFRSAYTPIIDYKNHFRNWFGVSFGYLF